MNRGAQALGRRDQTHFVAPDLADAPGLEFFFAYKLQHPILQQRFGEHLLELAVLPLQLLEPPGVVDFHLPELSLPAMEADLRDVMFSTDIQEPMNQK